MGKRGKGSPWNQVDQGKNQGQILGVFPWVFPSFLLIKIAVVAYNNTPINNVLLVKVEDPVWYTIYHHLPVVKGVNKPLYQSTNQW